MTVAARAHREERNLLGSVSTMDADLDLGLPDIGQAEVPGNFDAPLEIQNTDTVREIPEDLYDEEELAFYLTDELDNATAERFDFIDRLADYQDIYRAAEQPAKNFPFEGAANVVVPMVKEMVDTQTAALTQTVLVPGPPWIMKNSADEWRPFKSLIETFLELSGKRDLKYADRFEDFIREGVKLGTSIMEVAHEEVDKSFYIYNDDGTQAKKITRTVRSGPVLYNIPLEDFYIPFSEQDIQESPWIAKGFDLNRVQMKNRAERGLFRPSVVEELLAPTGWVDGDGHFVDAVKEKHEELEGTEPIYRRSFRVFEVWMSWNLSDGDDTESEIQVYFHRETGKILAVRFHPYRHGKRPFVVYRYKPVEYRFYGEGLCETLKPLQKIISTIHNQRLDNATIANMRMWSVRRGSKALRPGDKIHSNKIILRDQSDDVLPLQAGEVYPSTFNNEQIVRTYAERVAGVSDANSRGGFPVTRTTFGAQAALLQEQAKRLDNTIRNLRENVAEVGTFVLDLYFQFGAGSKPEAWMGRRGRILNGVFSLPVSVIEAGIGLEASAPTSALNRESQRQNSLALFNLLTQMFEKLLLMFQGLQPPPEVMAVVMSGVVTSAQQFMGEVLEQFEVTNPEDILAALTTLEQFLPNPKDFGGAQQFQHDEMVTQMLDKLDTLRDSMERTLEIQERTGGNGSREGRNLFLQPATSGSERLPGPPGFGTRPITPGFL